MLILFYLGPPGLFGKSGEDALPGKPGKQGAPGIGNAYLLNQIFFLIDGQDITMDPMHDLPCVVCYAGITLKKFYHYFI